MTQHTVCFKKKKKNHHIYIFEDGLIIFFNDPLCRSKESQVMSFKILFSNIYNLSYFVNGSSSKCHEYQSRYKIKSKQLFHQKDGLGRETRKLSRLEEIVILTLHDMLYSPIFMQMAEICHHTYHIQLPYIKISLVIFREYLKIFLRTLALS